jgi:hypothetical protein
VVCIKYVGSLPKGESSRLDLSIMRFAIPLAHHFLGRAFRGLGVLRESVLCVDNCVRKDFNFR